MNAKSVALLIASLLAATGIAWHYAKSAATGIGTPAPLSAAGLAAPSGAHAIPSAAGSPSSVSASAGYKAPKGDPLERYHAANTSAERMQVISDFITLGHEHNVFMLQEAVQDGDTRVRMLALQSAASMLTPEQAREVYRVSARSDDPEVRAMTWGFLAPHPMENRVAVYSEALQKGSDAAVEEALSEMGRTPEMPLFDTLLSESLNRDLTPGRSDRLLREMNDWLKPGGGNVPAFHSPAELLAWWQASRQHYDQFLLRLDQ